MRVQRIWSTLFHKGRFVFVNLKIVLLLGKNSQRWTLNKRTIALGSHMYAVQTMIFFFLNKKHAGARQDYSDRMNEGYAVKEQKSDELRL